MNDVLDIPVIEQPNVDHLVDKFSQIRKKTINNLERYLVQFESKFLQNGGKLEWAETAEDACLEVGKFISKTGQSFTYQANNVILNEIKLESYLMKSGLDKSVKVLSEHSGQSSSEGLILGGGFMVADSGSLWNAGRNSDIPSTGIEHNSLIVIVGLDQLTPSISDIGVLSSMFSSTGNGDIFSIIEQSGDVKNVKLIILDNGRSDLLAKPTQSQLLMGVSRFIGINETNLEQEIFRKYQLNSSKEFRPDLVPLDGYATYDPLVKLPMRDIVLAELTEYSGQIGTESDLSWRSWKNAVLSRKFMNKSKIGPFSIMRSFLKKGWTKKREFPKNNRSFNEVWTKTRPTIRKSKKLTEIPKGTLLVRKPATDGLSD